MSVVEVFADTATPTAAPTTQGAVMTGICLLCGFVTPDLDDLDLHVARHEWTSRRRARSIWRSYGWCPRCGAATGQPCVTDGGNVSSDPHAGRIREQVSA